MKDNIHSKEAWLKNKHKPIFKRKQSSDEYRERIDKDGLSWEDRQRINEIKEQKAQKEMIGDPFNE